MDTLDYKGEYINHINLIMDIQHDWLSVTIHWTFKNKFLKETRLLHQY